MEKHPFWKRIVENAVDGVAAIDSEGRITSLNKGMERIFHFSRAELIGRPADMLMSVPASDQGDSCFGPCRESSGFQLSGAGKKVLGRRKDGAEIPLYLTANPFSIEGKNYYLFIFQDLNEIRKSEEEFLTFKLCVEQSPSIIMITSVAGEIEYVNPKFTRITGYEPWEVLGKNPRFLKSGEKKAAEYKELWRTITSGAEWRGELHNRTKNGNLYWASASISPVRCADGTIRHFVAIQENITEQKRAHEKLHNAYQVISADMEAAAAIQKRLLPEPAIFEEMEFQWIFRPSSVVAGDTFNYFRLQPEVYAFYLADVSGHGVPAAILSASLNWILSHQRMEELERNASPVGVRMASPAALLKSLNAFFQKQLKSGQFITMVYGVLDLNASRVVMAQAGLPAPLLRTRCGTLRPIGSGGFPIGLLPEIDYEEESFDFYPGDRLYLTSDGVTECFDLRSRQFSGERLAAELARLSDLNLKEQLQAIENELVSWRGGSHFDDDVTLLAIERRA